MRRRELVHQLAILFLPKLETHKGERLKPGAETAPHPSRAFGHTTDQACCAGEAKDDSVGLSEVVTTQDNRFGRNEIHCNVRLPERNEVENPTKQESNDNKLGKDLQAIHESLPVIALGGDTEDNRGQRGEDGHPKNVSHRFLPAAMSKASSITK